MTKEQHEKLYQQLNADYHKNIEPLLLAKQWREKYKCKN